MPASCLCMFSPSLCGSPLGTLGSKLPGGVTVSAVCLYMSDPLAQCQLGYSSAPLQSSMISIIGAEQQQKKLCCSITYRVHQPQPPPSVDFVVLIITTYYFLLFLRQAKAPNPNSFSRHRTVSLECKHISLQTDTLTFTITSATC